MEIIHTADIATTPKRLYEALTTQAGLGGWYTPHTKADPKIGGLNEFRFGDGTTLAFRVENLEPARRVVWSPVQVPPDWTRSRLAFDIAPKPHGVALTLRHSGLPHEYRDFGCFSYLWAQYMRSLKLLLEMGDGEPYGSQGSIAAGTTPR